MSGRFRLDPRDAREEAPSIPRAPERPAPLAPRAPPPPAPMVAPAAAPTAQRRKLIVLGAVVVALLLVGGGVAVFVATALAYPDKYVLKPSEYPSGMSKAALDAEDMDDLGIHSNPGEMDQNTLDDFETRGGDPPKRGYAQVLEDGGGARVIIIAAKYTDEPDAQDAANQMRALCSFAGGAVLRDSEILVLVLPDSGASSSQVRSVALALADKTGDLKRVCGY